MSKANVKFPSAPDTSAIDIQDEGSVIVSNPTALNFTGPGVTVTENPSGTAEVDIPGLQYWTESEDATTQQSTIFTPNNSATDVNAVLLPKGTGANTAQTPDGTTTGGNARGQYATDWQKNRNNAAQVASGNYSTISGGRRNSASGTESTVIGGQASSAGGILSVAGGRIANASGGDSVAIGAQALASGLRSIVVAGNASQATANDAGVFSGNGCIASATHSKATGVNALAYQPGMFAFGSSNANRTTAGTVQHSIVSLTDSGDTAMTTGLTQTIGTFVLQDNNRAINVIASWTAVVVGISGTATGISVGDYIIQSQLFGFKRVSGTTSITSITTVGTHGDASITGTASMNWITGVNSLIGQLVAPTFSGGGTITFRTLIKLELVEIAWT